MSIYIDLYLGNEFDEKTWVQKLNTALIIDLVRRDESWWSPFFSSQLWFEEFKMPIDEEDDPDYQWVCFSLEIGRLRGDWNEFFEVCFRQSFVLVVQNELEQLYDVETVPFYDGQHPIKRGESAQHRSYQFKGRDVSKIPFGGSVEIRATGWCANTFVAALADIVPFNFLATNRSVSYLGMPVTVSLDDAVLTLERIVGVHPDDDLTFRIGTAVVVVDILRRTYPQVEFFACMDDGAILSDEDVPMHMTEAAPRRTSLVFGGNGKG